MLHTDKAINLRREDFCSEQLYIAWIKRSRSVCKFETAKNGSPALMA